jgi:membrane protease YdiL (CAAX protease family)
MLQEPEKFSVPWTGFDVLLLFLLCVMTLFATYTIVGCAYYNQMLEGKIPARDEAKYANDHAVLQMLHEGQYKPIVFLVAFLILVVAAPLLEEFLFRLILQGWLEAKLSQWGFSRAGGIAIVAVSLCFAAIHIKFTDGLLLSPQALFYAIVAHVGVSLLLFSAGMFYLIRWKNIKMPRILFGADRLVRPRFLTCAGCCLLIPLCSFGIAAVSRACLPSTNFHLIPIFFFSLFLGFIYCRTRNLVYCILLHAYCNAIILLLWRLLGS